MVSLVVGARNFTAPSPLAAAAAALVGGGGSRKGAREAKARGENGSEASCKGDSGLRNTHALLPRLSLEARGVGLRGDKGSDSAECRCKPTPALALADRRSTLHRGCSPHAASSTPIATSCGS